MSKLQTKADSNHRCRGLKKVGGESCNFSTDGSKYPTVKITPSLLVLKISILSLNFLRTNFSASMLAFLDKILRQKKTFSKNFPTDII